MVTKKFFFVVIYAINKFQHYIAGYLHIDHTTIKYLMNKLITIARIMKWLLLIQEFDITIVDKPGKDNVVADFLSRLDTSYEGAPVEDSFPYEHIFVISTHTL